MYPDWMSRIPDDRLLSDMSIPGTHESCARLHGGPLTVCQGMALSTQLKAGIRFIDIRCRHIEDVFTIHHGLFYQGMNFGSGVRDVCLEFLSANPSETIIMSVKEEYKAADNHRSFEETFKWYLEGYKRDGYLGTTIPKLGDVRGKIVLFRRFPAKSALGLQALPWLDDTTFVVNNSVKMQVQDAYVVPTVISGDLDVKWHRVKRFIDKARGDEDRATLYVNFASGASAGAYPRDVANWLNPRVKNHIRGLGQAARNGVIAMDFPEHPNNEPIATLIKQNL